MLEVSGDGPVEGGSAQNGPEGLDQHSLSDRQLEAQAELAQEFSKLSLDKLRGPGASQTQRFLQKVVEIAPEIAKEFLLGPRSQLKITPESHDLLRQMVARDYAHLRDTIEFTRAVYEAFRPLTKAEKESLAIVPADRDPENVIKKNPPLRGNSKKILEAALIISDKTLQSTDEASGAEVEKKNLRHMRSDIALKVLRGEARMDGLRQDAPHMMLDALARLASTDQDLSYFEDFSRKARTWNPYHATQIMKPNMHRFSELPEGTQEEYPQRTRSIESEPTTSARGQSGTFLNDEGFLHAAYSSFADGKIFLCKREGMLSIFRNWRSDGEFSLKASASRRKQRTEAVKDAAKDVASGSPQIPHLEKLVDILGSDEAFLQLEGVSLQDLQDSQTYQDLAKRNPILARELALYKELQRANEQLKSMNYRLWNNVDRSKEADRTHRILADQGGRFLGWFARRIEAEKNGGEPVPDHIKYAFMALSDTDFPLEPNKEQFYLDALMAYQALKSNIDGAIAFSGLIQDAEHLETLRADLESVPSSHPIHSAKFDFNAFLGDRADKLRSNEVSYPEFVELVEGSGIKSWRSQVNKWLHGRYEPEFSQALETLRSAFQNTSDKSWLPDSRGDAVPEKRLKGHLWGGQFVLQGVSAKLRSTLAHRDWKNAMLALTLEEYDRTSDHQALFEALPIQDFAEVLSTVCTAASKVKLLEENLTQRGYQIDAQFRNHPPAELQDGVRGLVGGYSKDNRLTPAAEYFDELAPLNPSGNQSPSEILKRFATFADAYYSDPDNTSDPGREIWNRYKTKLQSAATVGLVPGMNEGLERMFLEFTAAKTQNYLLVPESEYELLTFANDLQTQGLIDLSLRSQVLTSLDRASREADLLLTEDTRRPVLQSADYEILKAIWGIKEELQNSDSSGAEKLNLLDSAISHLKVETKTLNAIGALDDFLLITPEGGSKPDLIVNWKGSLNGNPILDCTPAQIRAVLRSIENRKEGNKEQLEDRRRILTRALRVTEEKRTDFRQAEERNFRTWIDNEFE